MFKDDSKGSISWCDREDCEIFVHREMPAFRLCPKGKMPWGGGIVQLGVPGPARRLEQRGRAVGSVWEDDNAVYCLLCGVLPREISDTRARQTTSALWEMEELLAAAGMTWANVVRTWMFIDNVCSWYGEFNAARTEFFKSRKVFETFLPASTGIGTPGEQIGAALQTGAFAMLPKRPGVYAQVVESPLQAPAMAYESSFSRAAEIVFPDARQLFVSGTASIEPDSHEVAFVGDIDAQIECTMNAVRAILSSRGYGWGEVTRAVVYLKNPEFRAAWRAWLAKNALPERFAMETVCDVCREEWLFEIELDAAIGRRII